MPSEHTIAIERQREALQLNVAAIRKFVSSKRAADSGMDEFIAQQRTIADMLEACVETDSPLDGAIALAEMQALQYPPDHWQARAWRGAAENLQTMRDTLTGQSRSS